MELLDVGLKASSGGRTPPRNCLSLRTLRPWSAGQKHSSQVLISLIQQTAAEDLTNEVTLPPAALAAISTRSAKRYCLAKLQTFRQQQQQMDCVDAYTTLMLSFYLQ